MKTAYGHVVVVDVPVPDGLSQLHEGERALCAPWGERRQATFAAGRLALRAALREAGVADVVVDGFIGRDDRGAPVLPPAVCGSVTHKDSVAAALVEVRNLGQHHLGQGDPGQGDLGQGDQHRATSFVGIDLELDEPEAAGGRSRSRMDKLAAQTLTDRELARLPDDDDERRRAIYQRFSLKEALYKAIDPIVRRYVGFHEVEVDLEPGSPLARFHLGTLSSVDGLVAEGAVLDVEAPGGPPGIILTAARVRRR